MATRAFEKRQSAGSDRVRYPVIANGTTVAVGPTAAQEIIKASFLAPLFKQERLIGIDQRIRLRYEHLFLFYNSIFLEKGNRFLSWTRPEEAILELSEGEKRDSEVRAGCEMRAG
ncbi:hypothetical protein [Cohnella thailandensis]|uniref:hypothetical protein n=1 Tax=Cohnella thailandensis TaxID=557557 RepID=UPI001FD8B8A2|nr:hypothetical protein [Cohnella thailandensis]